MEYIEKEKLNPSVRSMLENTDVQVCCGKCMFATPLECSGFRWHCKKQNEIVWSFSFCRRFTKRKGAIIK